MMNVKILYINVENNVEQMKSILKVKLKDETTERDKHDILTTKGVYLSNSAPDLVALEL